jgi:hypothetical protein
LYLREQIHVNIESLLCMHTVKCFCQLMFQYAPTPAK